MIERGLLLRAFFVLFAIAVIGALAATAFTESEDYGDVVETATFGPIFEAPAAYRDRLLGEDDWVERIPLRGGGTFGASIGRQVRVDIDGTGAIANREVTLQTPAAVAMFAGGQRDRAVGVLHGIEAILDDRRGLVRGISLTESRSGFQAAAIAGFVERRLTDGVTSPADQREITDILRDIGRDQAAETFAWYDGGVQQVVLGPEVSRSLLTFVRTPGRAKPVDNLFSAYVLRHEIEHSVTPAGGPGTLRWVEEGTADTLARWPGAAAATARALELPYPKRYDVIEYRTARGGYPEWTNTLRVLLSAAGVDWRDPQQLDDATQLLQEEPAATVPTALADQIGQRNRLSEPATRRLETRIRGLDGSTRAARVLVADLRGR